MQDTKKKLYAIIEKLMKNVDVVLSEDMNLIDDLNFDSIQLINLIIEIEEQFGVEFNDSDLLFDHFNRISDLCSLINQLLNKESR